MNYSTKIATNIKQRIHLTFLAKPQVKILYCHILYFCEHLINIFLVLFVFVLLPTCQRWSPPQRYGHCFCGRGGPWPAGFHLSPSPTDERRTRWAARSSLQNETVKTHFKDIVCEDKIRSICICWDHPEKIKTCQGTIWCSKDYRYFLMRHFCSLYSVWPYYTITTWCRYISHQQRSVLPQLQTHRWDFSAIFSVTAPFS